MKIGVVGYGTGGQNFHAPFIQATEGVDLGGIVARAEATRAKVRADFPDVPIFASLSEMIAAGAVDAVTVTTPPHTRRALVLEAVDAGLHVIADKPFAPNEAGALELTQAARAKGVVLSVYQNRRLDADVQTLRGVIEEGRLGEVWRIHNRMDFDDPATLEHGPTGGLLRDLGAHLVDQMLYLLGPAASVDCQMDFVDLPEGPTDASFYITLRHESGAHSHISASKLNRFDQRELRAYGEKGCFVSHATDVQAQSIFAGKRPADDPGSWGYEPEDNWPTLYTEAGAVRVPSAQGRYHDHYAAFRDAILKGTDPAVPGEIGARTVAVLDAARESAGTGVTVTV